MTIMKCINGVQVEMTPEEEAATLAQWAAAIQTQDTVLDPDQMAMVQQAGAVVAEQAALVAEKAD